MEQHQIVKIPLPDTMFDELDDAFIDARESAHDFIWGLIRNLCRDAKIGKLNKVCVINIIKDGQGVQDHIKLKGYELDIAEDNPDWLPPNMEKEEVKFFEHKITDKTLEYLKLFASFAILRHKKYGDSIQEENEKKLANMIENKIDQKVIDDAKENFTKSVEKFREGTPKYLEEILFTALYPQIHKKIVENVSKEFDKENEEMYPKEKTAKKSG